MAKLPHLTAELAAGNRRGLSDGVSVQATQNRDGEPIQVKLDEIIRAIG